MSAAKINVGSWKVALAELVGVMVAVGDEARGSACVLFGACPVGVVEVDAAVQE